VIDLSDVESITQGLSSSYMQQNGLQQYATAKKTLNNFISSSNFNESEAKNCFELRTAKRIYYFWAKSSQEAAKWVKQLQMCCDD
jgi:hypothetical protein